MGDGPFVLLVEDDPVNRGLAARILAAHGVPHDTAVDGLDALAKVAARRPAVILMDLSMPGMDGWETTRRLRDDPGNADIRIVAVTAHAMQGDREEALAAGCDDVLTKPYRPADLVAIIERALAAEPRRPEEPWP